ncbi:MAG: type II/IV secretion system ATPase subunit [Euryarchaeota archaeon]|nr:type II/IV secretion system ATPase subunit [Euryarchaeota archaeon]
MSDSAKKPTAQKKNVKKNAPKKEEEKQPTKKKVLKPCDYEIITEGDITRLVVKECRRCKASGNLENGTCFTRVLKTLSLVPNVDLIDLEKYNVREYFGEALNLLKGMLDMARVLENLGMRDPLSEYFGDIPEKERRKLRCPACPLNPQNIFKHLREIFTSRIDEFPSVLYAVIDQFGKEPVYSARCRKCRASSIDDLNYAFKKYVEWLSTMGINVDVSFEEQEVTPLLLLGKVRNMLVQVSGKDVKERVFDIINKNSRERPVFSPSWVVFDKPKGSILVKEYVVEDIPVKLYRLPTEIEGLYFIDPPEYHIPEEHIRLIDLARKELLAEYPKGMNVLKPGASLKYIEEEGAKLIFKLAKLYGIKLGEKREEEMQTVQRLAEYLMKFTAGYGIMEILFKDPYIQDIYLDAPVSNNNIYVILQGGIGKGIPERFVTNIVLSEKDAKSMISRFRMLSGRPFSEAHPLLEIDLKQYKTRVTAVGPPLSARGISFAFRRHSRVPWTLLRHIYFESATPMAAGLLSFLIDGNSTMLVTGSRSAGKTSLLSSILFEFPQSQRVIMIEDTPELPATYLQNLGYKVLPLLVRSTFGGTSELSMDDALRLALRLGESAIVIGEVRGQEARTLYEAMRAGTAGSAVLGTIHANAPRAVYERVVYDIGIPSMSFNATDVVVVAGFTRPSGLHRQIRKIVQISEYVKGSDGEFEDLMVFDMREGMLKETDTLYEGSGLIGRIAKAWGMDYEDAVDNIRIRAKIKAALVRRAVESGNLGYLSEYWVNASNNKMWELIAREVEEEGVVDHDHVFEKWKEWFLGR